MMFQPLYCPSLRLATKKARKLVHEDMNSVMKSASNNYEYETTEKLTVELQKKNNLSKFPNFSEESYRKLTQFSNAEVIH